MSRIITLTTDFGLQDSYVAAMKGTILSTEPGVTIVDVSHGIDAQDVMHAAYVLKHAYPYFPKNTVHLAVVDPGVGSHRRPIALRFNDHLFVGPDNGLFSLLMHSDQPFDAVALTNRSFWRTDNPSSTFHGRDIFAPAAAHLAAGRNLAELGSTVSSIVRLHWALPISDDQGIRGWVVHVDRFGNCITNISEDLLQACRRGRRVKTYVGTAIIEGLYGTYNDVEPGEPLVLFDSSGSFEIAVKEGHAAELLTIRKGSPVNVVFLD